MAEANSLRDDLLLRLCLVAVWLLPWAFLSFIGLCLLYLLQGTVSYTEDSLYWSAMTVFVASALLTSGLKTFVSPRSSISQAS